ncbi:MAG: SseB family protein [Micropruina sp.]|uniref:SseB family protein n=1 Tax=Micropruina sp. TaxID=2737536 RepID=UPI0039E26F18
MRTLGEVNAAWAGDRGDPDADVRTALATASGSGDPETYLTAVAALCGARLLLPIVADGDESGAGPDPRRHAEMSAVMMTSASGASGVLAFTGMDALRAFDPMARPVLCTLDEVAATAVEAGADAIVVDVAGPHLLTIEGELVRPLATGNRLMKLSDGWGWLSVAGS